MRTTNDRSNPCPNRFVVVLLRGPFQLILRIVCVWSWFNVRCGGGQLTAIVCQCEQFFVCITMFTCAKVRDKCESLSLIPGKIFTVIINTSACQFTVNNNVSIHSSVYVI